MNPLPSGKGVARRAGRGLRDLLEKHGSREAITKAFP